MISQTNHIDKLIVARHISDYALSKKLNPKFGGSQSKYHFCITNLQMGRHLILNTLNSN